MSQTFYESVVQNDGSFKRFSYTDLDAEKRLALLDLELAHRLKEGNSKDLYHLQRKIEKAKSEYELERTKERLEHKILDQILFCLFSPSSPPKKVPSNR
jgi:hypothetical protein